MATRRKKKGISNKSLGVISLAIFSIAIIFIATQTNLFDRSGLSSTDGIFVLQSLGQPDSSIKCFIKFEINAFTPNNIRIQLPSSSGDVDSSGNIISGQVLEGDLFSFVDVSGGTGGFIDRYEVTPELRCDKSNQSSGPIGWSVKNPTKLNLEVFAKDSNGKLNKVGNFQSASFSTNELHDNFSVKGSTINIDADLIDAKFPKFSYPYDGGVVMILGGGINLVDENQPNKVFTHFVSLSPSPVVSTEHSVNVLKKDEGTQLPEDPFDTPKETIKIISVRALEGNLDLISFQNAIDPTEPNAFQRSVRVFAELEDFRGTLLNINEQTPRVAILCLPESEGTGGVCNQLSTVGSISNMIQTGNNDVFEGTVIVPVNTNDGTYAVQVFSADRDGTGSKSFLIDRPLTASDCKSDEEFVNGKCIPEEPVSCPAEDEARDANTNTCVKIVVDEDDECESPLVGTYPDCKDPNAPDDDTEEGTGGTVECKEGENEVGGQCILQTQDADETADAYFTYIINLAGASVPGTINQETPVFSFTPQAIVGLDLEEKPRNLAEIRVTPTLDTVPLGAGVQIKSGTTVNTAQADLLVNDKVELENFNIDYPQRTFGQVGSGGLATFGLIGIQPAEIIDDANKRIANGVSNPLVFLNNDKLTVRITFSNEFEFTQGGKTFDGVISEMTAEFPFTYVKGIVTSGENEGCEEDEVFSDSLDQCVVIKGACNENQTLIGAHCVDNRNTNPDGSCNANESKIGNKCIPKQSTSATGTCTSPLVSDGKGACVLPASNEPQCDTGGSLFDPSCLVDIFNPSGTPSGSDGNGGKCNAGETAEQCQTRLQAAGTPLVSGGTLTFAIVGVVVLIIGVVIVAIIQQSRNSNGS